MNEPASNLRKQAQSILNGFGNAPPKRAPGIFVSIGRFIANNIIHPIQDFFHSIFSHFSDTFSSNGPFGAVGPFLFYFLIVLLACAVGYLIARKRAQKERLAMARARLEESKEKSWEELFKEAEIAESNGEDEQALRLRFQAGLLRVSELLKDPDLTKKTNRRLMSVINSRSFQTLARDFDEIIYAKRPITPDHVMRSKSHWEIAISELERSQNA
jgi:hypothetical protein